jgi:hypothetical protein
VNRALASRGLPGANRKRVHELPPVSTGQLA